jgi:cation transport regulator ChaC
MPWIFGYGSLIYSKSRERTASSGEAIPIRLRGWQRGWNGISEERGVTYLGVRRAAGANCNGVLVSVAAEELEEFDRRERGYRRDSLSPVDLAASERPIASGEAWIYVPHRPGSPSASCPIAQSYLDVVVAGCLGIDAEFAREFVRTTEGWEPHWINDREHPRYERAEPGLPLDEIDSVLAACGHPRPR